MHNFFQRLGWARTNVFENLDFFSHNYCEQDWHSPVFLGWLEYIAVIFLYISAWLCSSFHGSFEYTLRSIWRLNRLTQAKNTQCNLVWVYRSRRMHWHICWPKWFIVSIKKYQLILAHLLEFPTFYDCLLCILVVLKLSSMLNTEL